jgi:DamX protein
MVENDTFTYHVKQSFIAPKSSDLHALISPERARTLELLNHLLANSSQTLVVCGSEGIGKSTLLKVLQEHKMASWRYCRVPGNAGLSFEKLKEYIAVAIKQDQSGKQDQALSGAFLQLESQRKKLILMIDDAGLLAPGLINKVIAYAEDNPVLRVIFVLTHDDLTEKNSSDNALDESHLIEIPALSEQQCGEFLQYLAAKPRAQIALSEINEAMIAAVYRETQGIPGRIIAGFPGFDDAKQSPGSLGILVAAVAGLVVLALCTQWYSASKYNIKPVPPTAAQVQKPAELEITAPEALPSLTSDTQ